MLQSLSQYPHWFVATCALVVAALGIWIILKLIKAALWILLFVVLFVVISAGAWALLH